MVNVGKYTSPMDGMGYVGKAAVKSSRGTAGVPKEMEAIGQMFKKSKPQMLNNVCLGSGWGGVFC